MSFESRGLLDNTSSSWVSRSILALGLCAAALSLASPAATSLFSSSSVTSNAPVAVQSVLSVNKAAPVIPVFGAADAPSGGPFAPPAPAAQLWTSLAVMAAAPIAVLGVMFATKPKEKLAVDPLDLSTVPGTQWAMIATSGDSAVARNYANALIELAQEGKCLEQIHTDVDTLEGLLEDETFATFLNNPIMSGDNQREVLSQLCDENNMSEITKNFLCYLVDKRRISQLPLICVEFDEQYYEVTGTQVATVTGAVALSEEQLRLIANQIHEATKGKNVKLKSQVDSDLLAGFVLEFGKNGSSRIDLSLKGQLEELKGEMEEGVRLVLSSGVPAATQVLVTALGVNALLTGHASAATGNVFDFGLTMPLQMIQFLLLMVFLDKTVFGPVGKMIDDRAQYIKQKSGSATDNSKDIAALNAEAESLLDAARRDAARELEAAKKEAAAVGAEKKAKAKAELDASLKLKLEELEKSKDELWAKLEAEVVPVLADEIVKKVLSDEEEEPAAATTTATAPASQ